MLDVKPVASLHYNVLNGFNQSHINCYDYFILLLLLSKQFNHFKSNNII